MINYSEDELYNLTKPSTDFDCLPMAIKVEEFVNFIIRSGNNQFSIDDLRELFSKSKLKSPRTGKVINPTPYQLDNQVDRLILNGKISDNKDDNTYKITNND